MINKIICGDSLKVLTGSEHVDLIISDPPYPDFYTSEFNYKDELIEIFNRYNCRQFIFWSAKVSFPLSYTARHVWDKITGAACQYDFIYERNGYKKQKVFRGHRINSTVSAQFAKEKFYGQKAQKPLSVLIKLIEYASSKEDLILDPFMGTGTTCIASKILGRKYIGIDINPKCYKIVQERLTKVQPKGDWKRLLD